MNWICCEYMKANTLYFVPVPVRPWKSGWAVRGYGEIRCLLFSPFVFRSQTHLMKESQTDSSNWRTPSICFIFADNLLGRRCLFLCADQRFCSAVLGATGASGKQINQKAYLLFLLLNNCFCNFFFFLMRYGAHSMKMLIYFFLGLLCRKLYLDKRENQLNNTTGKQI